MKITIEQLEKKYMKLMEKFHKQYNDIRDMNFK
jgi:hypothetical protein